MKRKLVLMLMLVMVGTTMAACGQSSSETAQAEETPEATETPEETETPTPTETEEPEETEEATETPEVTETPEETQAAEATEAAETKNMYTTLNLYLQVEENGTYVQGDLIAINTKVEVVRVDDDGWTLVKVNGKEGYLESQYLTEDAEVARAAAADASATTTTNTTQASSGSEIVLGDDQAVKTPVKTEDYPDCDGSGHGYKIITYDDGSTEKQEY